MTHTEALKLALEALGKWSIGFHVDAVELNDLIATLDAALEQPEQEPVRLQCVHCGTVYTEGVPPAVTEQEPVAVFREWRTVLRKLTFMARTSGGAAGHDSGLSKACDEAEALLCKPYTYTHPPRREWRGLTEEEMKSTCADTWSYDPYVIARAIEAALKERNA